MEELERVQEPVWSTQLVVQVRSVDDEEPVPLDCQIYVRGHERTLEIGIFLGPMPEYTVEHAELFMRSSPHCLP